MNSGRPSGAEARTRTVASSASSARSAPWPRTSPICIPCDVMANGALVNRYAWRGVEAGRVACRDVRQYECDAGERERNRDQAEQRADDERERAPGPPSGGVAPGNWMGG